VPKQALSVYSFDILIFWQLWFSVTYNTLYDGMVQVFNGLVPYIKVLKPICRILWIEEARYYYCFWVVFIPIKVKDV